MATIRFNLRKSGYDWKTKKVSDKAVYNKSEQPIYLIIRHKKEKVTYPIGFNIRPAHWNFDREEAKSITACLNKDKINAKISSLKDLLSEHFDSLKVKNIEPTKESIKDFLDRNTGKVKETPTTLFGFIKDFLDTAHTRIIPKTGQAIKPRTLDRYKVAYRKLSKFSEYSGRKYDFKDINYSFYKDYTDFLTNELKHATNTIGKEIKILKTFLNEATKKGLTSNISHTETYFRAISEKSEAVYLNETELKQLYVFDFSYNKKLEKVRDLFIVGCWTGLRFSDLSRVAAHHIVTIKGELYIDLEQQKTGGKVLVPMKKVVVEIWDKYGQSFPNTISNQRFNEYIKEVCELADLSTIEHKAITKGGKRISSVYKKYELVTSHTARRSFATNLFKSGYSVFSIRQITGHKTEDSFFKYIKARPDEHAISLNEHWKKIEIKENRNNMKVV